VREFFIGNALYWLGEFRFDGLRLDAVHAITDPPTSTSWSSSAARARDQAAREGRQVHLVLENEAQPGPLPAPRRRPLGAPPRRAGPTTRSGTTTRTTSSTCC
jgi:hypothetical protein